MASGKETRVLSTEPSLQTSTSFLKGSLTTPGANWGWPHQAPGISLSPSWRSDYSKHCPGFLSRCWGLNSGSHVTGQALYWMSNIPSPSFDFYKNTYTYKEICGFVVQDIPCSCKEFLWLLCCSVMALCCFLVSKAGNKCQVSTRMCSFFSQSPVQGVLFGVLLSYFCDQRADKKQYHGLFGLRVWGCSLSCGGTQGGKYGFSCGGKQIKWVMVFSSLPFYSAGTPAHGIVSSTFTVGFLEM